MNERTDGGNVCGDHSATTRGRRSTGDGSGRFDPDSDAAMRRFSVGPPAGRSSSLSPPALNVFCACVWSRRLESVLKKNHWWVVFVFFLFFRVALWTDLDLAPQAAVGTASETHLECRLGGWDTADGPPSPSPIRKRGRGPPRVERFAFFRKTHSNT